MCFSTSWYFRFFFSSWQFIQRKTTNHFVPCTWWLQSPHIRGWHNTELTDQSDEVELSKYVADEMFAFLFAAHEALSTLSDLNHGLLTPLEHWQVVVSGLLIRQQYHRSIWKLQRVSKQCAEPNVLIKCIGWWIILCTEWYDALWSIKCWWTRMESH